MADDADTRTPRSARPGPPRRSILVVEDEPLLRDALGRALEGAEFDVVTAASAPDARRAFHQVDPDGIVMDVDLGPGPNGFDLAEALLELHTGVAIVFLTNLPDARFAGRKQDSLPAAIAYLRKSAVSDVGLLVSTLDAALRQSTEALTRHDRAPDRPLAGLTRGQIDVLRLIASGYSNAQIAERRGITQRAAEKSVERAFSALSIEDAKEGNTRVVAVRRFLESAGQPLPITEFR